MAGQFVDMSRAAHQYVRLNGEITKRYQELGRFIYETRKAGSGRRSELADRSPVSMICLCTAFRGFRTVRFHAE